MDAGKERPTSQEFRYACLGYSVWEDAAASRGGDVGAQMPAVLCTGLEVCSSHDRRKGVRLESRFVMHSASYVAFFGDTTF